MICSINSTIVQNCYFKTFYCKKYHYQTKLGFYQTGESDLFFYLENKIHLSNTLTFKSVNFSINKTNYFLPQKWNFSIGI